MTPRRLFALLVILFIVTLVALLSVRGSAAGQDRSSHVPIPPMPHETPPRSAPEAGAAPPAGSPAEGRPAALPSFFYGDTQLSGGVVDPAGNPSIGSRVNCRPVSFALLAPVEIQRFETTTDEQGRFMFPGLPSDRGFVITATQGAMFASVSVGRKDMNTSVRLQLGPVTYERYRFLDGNGPVSVSFAPDIFLGGSSDVLWTTLAPRTCPAWILERIGAPELHVTRGEVAIVYGNTIRGLETTPRMFRADGYEPVVVPTVLRPLTEWPACTDVRVSRVDDGRVLYRVVPPAIEASGLPETVAAAVSVYLESEQRAAGHRVAPRQEASAFMDMPTVTISIRLEDRPEQAERLNYVTEVADDGAFVIRPQYPEWAFIRLTHGSCDAWDTAICVTRTGWVHAGVSLYPGTVYFGPVPVDRYEFRILRPVRGVPRVLKVWGPITVHEGLNALQWPD